MRYNKLLKRIDETHKKYAVYKEVAKRENKATKQVKDVAKKTTTKNTKNEKKECEC